MGNEDSAVNLIVRGRVGFVVKEYNQENALRTAVYPSDHLESLLFLAHYP